MEIATPIGERYNPANTRQQMAATHPELEPLTTDTQTPAQTQQRQSDMATAEF